ncbi:hypothetical protein GOV09_01950 [Candidatus Woesearchaeota archaeon]|nr:hypothetical protein [Candidatus Woesearchaeota archaeon]
MQYCEIVLRSLGKEVEHILPYTMQNLLIVPDNENQSCYFDTQEYNDFMNALVDHFTGSAEKFREFIDLFFKIGQDYVDFCKKIHEKDVENLHNDELKQIILDYYPKAIDYTCILWVGFLLNQYWTEANTKDFSEDVRKSMLIPAKKTTVMKMQEEASKISPNDPDKIAEFMKKYQWIPCLDIHHKPWKMRDATAYIITHTELPSEQFITEPESDKEFFTMVRELVYIKEVRDDFRRKGVFYIQKLYQEIAKRAGIDLEDIAYWSEPEIIQFLEDKKIEDKTSRKKGFMLYFKDGKITYVDENISDELKNLGFSEEERNDEIKGTVAQEGTAKGKVKIVRTVKDIPKVEEGDIMVTVTTHPDYVLAMQKAAAIVTDEGGVTSHAAIVSRELKKPCIVGTKHATKILKDGEIVEVDAVNGTVKR